MIIALAIAVVLGSFGAWLYGEIAHVHAPRILGAISCFLLFPAVAGSVGGLHASLSIGIPISEAMQAYVAEASGQLKAGHVEFVITALDEFQDRVPVTYESGAIMRDLRTEVERMRQGSLAAESENNRSASPD